VGVFQSVWLLPANIDDLVINKKSNISFLNILSIIKQEVSLVINTYKYFI
jgi:hypothetical protein